MQVQIQGQDVVVPDPLRDLVERKLSEAMRPFGERITRVEVHLRDMNKGKAGIDKRCTLEARPAGLDPIVVSHDADELVYAVEHAVDKLGRALRNRFERLNDKRK